MATVRMRIVEEFEYEVNLDELDPEAYPDTSSVEAAVQQDITDLQSGLITAYDLTMDSPEITEITFEILPEDEFVD